MGSFWRGLWSDRRVILVDLIGRYIYQNPVIGLTMNQHLEVTSGWSKVL